jgi:hypothetical protein
MKTVSIDACFYALIYAKNRNVEGWHNRINKDQKAIVDNKVFYTIASIIWFIWCRGNKFGLVFPSDPS